MIELIRAVEAVYGLSVAALVGGGLLWRFSPRFRRALIGDRRL